MFCSKCGAADQSADSYCKRCGEWLPDTARLAKEAQAGARRNGKGGNP